MVCWTTLFAGIKAGWILSGNQFYINILMPRYTNDRYNMRLHERSQNFEEFRHYWNLTRDYSIAGCLLGYPGFIKAIKKDVIELLSEVQDPYYFLKRLEMDLNDALKDVKLKRATSEEYVLIDKIWGWTNILRFAWHFDEPLYQMDIFKQIFQVDLNRSSRQEDEIISDIIREKGLELLDDIDFRSIHGIICSHLYINCIDALQDFVSEQIILLGEEKAPIEKITTLFTVEQIALFFRLFYQECVDQQKTGKREFTRTIVRSINKQDGTEIKFDSLNNKMKPKALLSGTTKEVLKKFYEQCLKELDSNPNFR
jgi:hypothetical protein